MTITLLLIKFVRRPAMKSITINFSKCKYPMDLHSEIKEKLELPEWYGNNLMPYGICLQVL